MRTNIRENFMPKSLAPPAPLCSAIFRYQEVSTVKRWQFKASNPCAEPTVGFETILGRPSGASNL